jgi:uncharacterized delta-60 repeat protein
MMAAIFTAAKTAVAAPGDLDSTFNTTGVATTAVTANNDEAHAVAIQPDGKIVTVGRSVGATEFALVRYTSAGALDTTFGTGGIVRTAFAQASLNAVALQADGKIVVGGFTQSPQVFTVARYTAAGTLDGSFGSAGIVTTSAGGNSEVFGLAIQPDGKIVAAGKGGGDFVVVRYNPGGSLDLSFNFTGVVTTSFGGDEGATAVKLQSDGKIVVVGAGTNYGIARFTTSGVLDSTFGVGGKVSTNVGNTDQARGVAVDTSGNILVAGFTVPVKTDQDIFISRHLSNGDLDPVFDGGGDGIVIESLGSIVDRANGVALQSDGKIVLAGSFLDSATDSDFAALRYVGLGPSAAEVTLGGRILTTYGYGADGVTVLLSGGPLSQPEVAITNPFGYYNFYDIEVGHTYIVTPQTGRYSSFSPPNMVVNLTDEFLGANFTAIE